MKKILFFALLITLFACQKKEVYHVNGYVKYNNLPVADAQVYIDSLAIFKTSTNSFGFFTIPDAPEGLHSIYISKIYADGAYVLTSKALNINHSFDTTAYTLPSAIALANDGLIAQATNNQVELSWTPTTATDFANYKIYRHSNEDFEIHTATLMYVSLNKAETSFIDIIPYNSTYYYRVLTNNNSSTFAGSNIIEVITGANPNL